MDTLNIITAIYKNELSKVNDEKIEDTLMDMANYAILAVMELRGYDN